MPVCVYGKSNCVHALLLRDLWPPQRNFRGMASALLRGFMLAWLTRLLLAFPSRRAAGAFSRPNSRIDASIVAMSFFCRQRPFDHQPGEHRREPARRPRAPLVRPQSVGRSVPRPFRFPFLDNVELIQFTPALRRHGHHDRRRPHCYLLAYAACRGNQVFQGRTAAGVHLLRQELRHERQWRCPCAVAVAGSRSIAGARSMRATTPTTI